jgi:hypothetical protein
MQVRETYTVAPNIDNRIEKDEYKEGFFASIVSS